MQIPECYLVSPDKALRAAIREQWTAAAPAGAFLHESDDLPASLSSPIAALILDDALADEKNLDLLRDWQKRGKKPKIFVLGEIEDNSGPDNENLVTESFSKPLRLGHLLARMQFHLQPARAQTGPFVFGAFRLEPSLRQIVSEPTGAIIRLTEKETHLLEYLGRSRQPISREELLAAIWGYDARIDTHTLETHIYRLRRKLDPEGRHASVIIAKSGAYRLAARTK